MIAAPSARTKPLLSLSNGRLASAGRPDQLDRAPRARNASMEAAESGVSVAPARTAAAAQRSIFSAAHATASRPATQAVAMLAVCPRAPTLIAKWLVAACPGYSRTVQGRM